MRWSSEPAAHSRFSVVAKVLALTAIALALGLLAFTHLPRGDGGLSEDMQMPVREEAAATREWVWARYRFWMEEGHPGVVFTDFDADLWNLPDTYFETEMERKGPATIPALIDIARRRKCYELISKAIRRIDGSYHTKSMAEIMVRRATVRGLRSEAVNSVVGAPPWYVVDDLLGMAFDKGRPAAERRAAVDVLKEIADGVALNQAARDYYSSGLDYAKRLWFRRGPPEGLAFGGLLPVVERLERLTYGVLYGKASRSKDQEIGEAVDGWRFSAASAVRARRLLEEVPNSHSGTPEQLAWAQRNISVLGTLTEGYLGRHLSCGDCVTALIHIQHSGGPVVLSPRPRTDSEWEAARQAALRWLGAQPQDTQNIIARGYCERLAALELDVAER